jgi:hypothetical protein
MPFKDEIEAAAGARTQGRAASEIAAEKGRRPVTPAEEAKIAANFAASEHLYAEKDLADVGREMLYAEIDSLRARLEALEGA